MDPAPPSPGPITPLPLPSGATHALFFGGSFDPPHLAHARLPPLLRDRRLGMGAWLVYIPAARSPLKAHNPVAPDTDRLAMLRLAIRAVDRALVWSDEIDRAPASAAPSYTIDTFRRARAILPPAVRLALLIGSDQCAPFHRWRQPREILALAEPIVMLRAPHRTASEVIEALGAASFWTPAELQRWEAAIDGTAIMDASSTILRALLAAHDPGASVHLDPEVLRYIEAHDLYNLPRSA